ncbi:MAG: hypothetical protein ACI31V_04200 [Bacilli bacterium]
MHTIYNTDNNVILAYISNFNNDTKSMDINQKNCRNI